MSSVQGSDGSRFSGGAAGKWTDVRETVTFVRGPAKSRRFAPYQRGQQGNRPASDVERITSQNMHGAFRGH